MVSKKRSVRKKSKKNTEDIYNLLKKKLVSFEYRPGQSLGEKDIASHFKVSRTPVRHAFSKLERDGLVEIIARKGAFIKFLSMKDILEIFQVRKALEGMAARLAAKSIDIDALKDFENLYQNALQENSNDSLQKIFKSGIKFHNLIIRSANNQRIEKVLKDFRVQFEICRIFFLQQSSNVYPSRAVESIKEHLQIIEALKEQNGELAEMRMREHIANAEKYTFSFREFHT
jgi:DNA-binding GntR family transcriptional regulator